MRAMLVMVMVASASAATWAQGASAAQVDRFLVATSRQIAEPRLRGKWLTYHVGREGRTIYDLAQRQPHDRIRQYQRIPYGINDTIVLDYDPRQSSGWIYRYATKQRTGFRVHRLGEVERMWMAHDWFAYDQVRIDPQTMRKTTTLNICDLANRWRRTFITRRFDPESVAVGHSVLVWYNPWVGEEGIWIFDKAGAADGKGPRPKRLIEVVGVIRPDTDDRRIAWFDTDSAYYHDLKTGKTADLLEGTDNRAATAVRIDRDWAAWADDDWQIFARHLPTGKVVRVTSSDDAGFNELIDLSGGYIVWRCADQLWAAKLTAPKKDVAPESRPAGRPD